MSYATDRIWLDERQLRHEWFGDRYELLTVEEVYTLVAATCAQYETLFATKLVMRLLPAGCNMSCWPAGYEPARLHGAVAAAFRDGFANTPYLPSHGGIAERLWGSDGYFAEQSL